MAMTDVHRGRCLCGAVRFSAQGKPDWVAICHCESCRRATGGIVTAVAGYPRERVQFEGEQHRIYESSPGVRRGFCAKCGSSLTYEGARWPDDVHVLVAAFDRPEDFPPQVHVFAAECVSWLKLRDNLPRFRTFPSEGTLLPPMSDI
jgi:hypothetical protein